MQFPKGWKVLQFTPVTFCRFQLVPLLPKVLSSVDRLCARVDDTLYSYTKGNRFNLVCGQELERLCQLKFDLIKSTSGTKGTAPAPR